MRFSESALQKKKSSKINNIAHYINIEEIIEEKKTVAHYGLYINNIR